MTARVPRVSVVMSFYNAAQYLENAIQSVLSQTCTDWELLLVDDGSTDGGSAVALVHAARDPDRIRYLEHPAHANRGFAASRNLGCQAARGDYLASLDADDTFLTATALEEQVAVLETHPEVASVYGPAEYWFTWSSRPAEDVRQQLTVPMDAVVPPPIILTRFLERQEDQPIKETVRRDIYLAVGGFDERMVQFEDAAFSAKVCLRYPVYVSSRSWYRYRQRPDSSWQTERASGGYDLHHHAFMTWLRAYNTTHGSDDPELARVIRTRSRPLAWRRLHRLLTERLPIALRKLYNALQVNAQFHLHRTLLRRTAKNGNSTGTLSPRADSLELHPWTSHSASVVLEWNTTDTASAELRADAPDGPVIATGSAGRVATGFWVRSPALFYLQDATRQPADTVRSTLAVARVVWTPRGRMVVAACSRPTGNLGIAGS